MKIVTKNSLTLSNVNDGTITHYAYANSADGTDGFYVGGGTNYFLNSSKFKITPTGQDNYDWNDIKISPDFFKNPSRLKPNNIRISFTIYAVNALPADFNGNMYFRNSPWYSKPFSYPKGTTEKKSFELIYSITDSTYSATEMFIRFMAKDTSGYPFVIENAKLEIGDTFTPWSPAPSEAHPSYIGQYTDFNTIASTDPAKYAPWIIFKGNDGKDGVNGKDGIAGKDGVGIKTTVITYAISTSGTTAPTTGWTSSVPSLVKGQYLWTKTVWAYTDNSSETGYSVTYISKDGNNGNDGIAGKDGVGIKTTTITYAGSTSGTTAPTSGWSATVPAVEAGSYLWTKTVWTYTDNTSETGYSVAKMGNDGPKGDTGSILGENMWIGHKYSYPGSTRIYPSFDHIQGITPIATQIFNDSTRFTFSDDYYIAHFQSNLYVNIDKQITTTVTHDDDLTIYCNDEVVVSKNSTISTAYDITFNLKAGWNKIDILLHEISGGDQVTFGTKLSSLVEHLSYIKGPKGDKGDTGRDGIAGKDGNGIKATTITYAQSTNGTTAPTTGWTSSVPSLVKGQYVWTKTVWTYTDNSSETGYSVTYISKDGNNGTDGIAGKDGVGITATSITYVGSTSGITAPTTGWTPSVPSVPAGQFLWTKTVWRYSDNTSETGYSVAMMGPKGADGKTQYTHIAYANIEFLCKEKNNFTLSEVSLVRYGSDSRWVYKELQAGTYTATTTLFGSDPANGTQKNVELVSGFSTSNSMDTTHIGIYVDFVESDSVDPSKYNWTLVKGADGTQGIPGKAGADGKTPYWHTAYANSADGITDFSLSISDGKRYIGQYTDYTSSDSTNPTKYKWVDMIGNISVGGRNLVLNSALVGDANNDNVPDSWTKGGATATSKLVSVTDLNQITTGVEITQTTLGQSGLRSYNFIENIQPNASYAQSFWIKNVDSNPLNMVVEISERNKETNEVTYSATNQVVPVNSGWVRLSRVFTTKNTTNGLYFYLYTDTTMTNAHYILAAPKLELGNIVTDYSAAPEDTQVKIERLEEGLKTMVSQSKYNADQTTIDSKISSVIQTANSVNSIVTNLINGMPTGSSIISQISDSVSILVEKDDVIHQINVSTEGILIAGSKVHITGTTLIDDAIITTAMIKELDASVIRTGTLAANLIVPTAGNMLMNSEFQSTTFFDGWNTSGSNPALFYDSTSSYSDSYGGQSYAAGINSIGNGSTTWQWRRLNQDVRGRENFPYSASTMALSNKNANGGWLKFAISFLDSSKAIISTITSDQVVMDNKYHLLKIENAIAPTGTAYVRYEYQAGGEVNGYVTRAMLNRGAKALPYTASTGQVIVGSDMIVDGAIIAKHLAVGSITAEKLAVGAVNMGSAVITGTLDANRINVINLDASQIKVGTLDAAVVRIINLDASAITTGTLNVAVQINANSIVTGTLNAKLLTGDTAHLNSVDTGNITNNYDYHLQVSSKGLFNKTTNVGQLNLHSTQSGGSDWDAAFPGSMTYHFETSAGGQNTGLRFWKNHIMSLNTDQNSGLFLNPYGGTQVRVTSRTDDNTYLAINASAFNVASDRRFKSDIQDYEEDALSIVNSLRIRTYEKSGKREIGVIADEAPDNLLLKDEKGDMLSLYDYSSIAIKAIQELTEEVSSLKQQMKEMEKHIA